MKQEWVEVPITKITLAIYVPPKGGRDVHRDRTFHGFVLNDENSRKDYCFSSGQVLHTAGNEFFYLPKHSSYRVESIRSGGCYAINFDAEISDEPFCIRLKNHALLKKSFKAACDEWLMHAPACRAAAMRALYEAIYLAQKEQAQDYMPNSLHHRILPAIEVLQRDFANRELTVASLAELCGMSEVYFRKIFTHQFGVSPKEYIIRRRMEYASQLLDLGEFEVAEIAELCGYSEPCHFSREFKKHFGVSPNNYQ